jgi:uncharacterized protein YcnI
MPLRARRLTTVAIAALAALAVATAAVAHVTVNPRSVNTGSFARFDVRVPNERPDAGTVKVELQFPEDVVLRSVSVQPHTGWTHTIQRRTLDTPVETEGGQTVTEVVSLITWEAESGVQIAPGEFEEFGLSVGPMPEAPTTLTFKAIQTYSSGEVVRWIDAPDAELPAPQVNVVAPTEPGFGPAGPAGPAGPQGAAGESGGGVLAIVALIVGTLGLVAGGAALLRGRSG